MKVKEIEIFNPVYQEGGILMPSPKDVVTATLAGDGTIIHVTVNKPVGVGRIRRIILRYNVVDMQLQSIGGMNIATITQTIATSVDFNIEVVKKTLIRSSSSMITVNYDVTLFTYEANINTTYGSKRLSYPYTASISENAGFPLSTDGWYSVSILDIPVWLPENTYVPSDVVYDATLEKFARCLTESTGQSPATSPDLWEAMTEESWAVYGISSNRVSDNDASLRIVSELLVTRNVKQAYIFPCIQATSFKEYNDKIAMEGLTKITAMREAAVAYLESGDPIKAVDMINRIPFEYHTLFGGNKPTLISNNNFTL